MQPALGKPSFNICQSPVPCVRIGFQSCGDGLPADQWIGAEAVEVIGAVHGRKDQAVSNQADPCFDICEGIQHRCDGWRSREEHRDHGVVIGFQFGGEGPDGSVADGEVKGFGEGVFSYRRG
jgi:hypothetical protein